MKTFQHYSTEEVMKLAFLDMKKSNVSIKVFGFAKRFRKYPKEILIPIIG